MSSKNAVNKCINNQEKDKDAESDTEILPNFKCV